MVQNAGDRMQYFAQTMEVIELGSMFASQCGALSVMSLTQMTNFTSMSEGMNLALNGYIQRMKIDSCVDEQETI